MIELQCIKATVVPPNTSLDACVGDKVPSLYISARGAQLNR